MRRQLTLEAIKEIPRLEESLAKLKTFRMTEEEPEEHTIPIHEFAGIPELASLNPEDYQGITYYVHKDIHPEDDLQRVVDIVLVNLFTALPGNDYEPGREYDGKERQRVKEQLGTINKSLECAEIGLTKYPSERRKLGSFHQKIGYWERDYSEFMRSDFFDGKESYHVLYVEGMERLLAREREEFMKRNADQLGTLLEDALTRCGGEFEEKATALEQDPEFVKEEAEELLTQILDEETEDDEIEFEDDSIAYVISNFALLFERFVEYQERDLTYSQRTFLELITPIIRKTYEELQTVKSQIETLEAQELTSKEDILGDLSKKLYPNGVLILEGKNPVEVPGLRLVDSYDTRITKIHLYQKL